jgi:hypothetical protein
MTLSALENDILIDYVSNQSTGYCPEPESWWAVAMALERAGFAHRKKFDFECHFRCCEKCKTINLVKEHIFICAVCDHDLPINYNIE